MLDKIKNRKESGFTIVEVMIVLAIAGLIILVVFLAVPALQRSSRNTQRTSDASLIAAAINECLTNRNGQIVACNTPAEVNAYIDMTKLRQFTTTAFSAAMPTNATTVNFTYGVKCLADGSAVDTAATNVSSRSAVIQYNTENSAGGLVGRCQEV